MHTTSLGFFLNGGKREIESRDDKRGRERDKGDRVCEIRWTGGKKKQLGKFLVMYGIV